MADVILDDLSLHMLRKHKKGELQTFISNWATNYQLATLFEHLKTNTIKGVGGKERQEMILILDQNLSKRQKAHDKAMSEFRKRRGIKP